MLLKNTFPPLTFNFGNEREMNGVFKYAPEQIGNMVDNPAMLGIDRKSNLSYMNCMSNGPLNRHRIMKGSMRDRKVHEELSS